MRDKLIDWITTAITRYVVLKEIGEQVDEVEVIVDYLLEQPEIECLGEPK